MANITPKTMRGLIVPTSTITQKNIWKAQSTFTEQNPRAGVAKADQPYTGLVLQTSGTQEQEYQIETLDGGLPGESATFKWAGTDTVQLGQNANNIITDWKYLKYTSIPFNNYGDFDCVGSSDGTLYFVTEYINTTRQLYTLRVSKQTQDGAVTTLETFINIEIGTAPTETAKPMINIMKDGSLVVCYFDYVTGTEVNLYTWRSYDDGVTWSQISRRALEVPITVGSTNYSIETASLVVSDDSLVIFMSMFYNPSNTAGNPLWQYISRDGGATFRLVGGIQSETYHMATAMALPQGKLGVAYISDDRDISFTRIPHGGVTLSSGAYQTEKEVTITAGSRTWATKTTDQLSDGRLTAWYQDGVIYVLAMDSNDEMYGFQSTDLGDTWRQISETNSSNLTQALVYKPESSTGFTAFKSCVWEGRAVVLARTNDSIGCLYLGGWSDLHFPERVTQPDRNQYHGFVSNWVHNQVPDTSSAWNTVGAGTAAIQEEGLNVRTTNQQKYFTYQGSIDPQMYFRFKVKLITGTALAGDYIVVKLQSADTSNSYTLTLRLAPTNFKVRDHSSQLASVDVDLTEYVEFVVFQDTTDVLVYHRPWDEKQAKKWTETSVTLGTQAPGGVSRLEWGHIQILGSGIESLWSEFHVSLTGVGKPASVDRGGIYPTFGEYTYIDQGFLLTSRESPARAGDTYTIEPRADYPVDHIFHQVALSPRVVWRSKADNLAEQIAWYIDPVVGASARSLGLSDVMGLHLSGINWRQATLQTWNGTSWDTVETIDTSTGLTSTYKLAGSTIEPAASGAPFYLHYDECRGWYAQLSNGEDTVVVKIKQNSEGVFGTDSTYKRAILVIDTSETDPATIPSSGTIQIMPTSITLVAELFNSGATVGQYAYRLSLPAQPTLEGYFQIGTMVHGSVYFMAPQYQRGRTISHSPNIQSVTTLDNQFYARQLSEGSRTYQIAWTEPVDSRQIMELAPDYWQFSNSAGSQPVANYGDAPHGMLGLCRYLANRVPVVYLPTMVKSTGDHDIQLFNRYHEHSLVRPTGDVSMESVLGEEQEDEMFRVATVTFTEVE